MEKVPEAVTAAKEGVRLAPLSADAYLCLGLALHSPENFSDAAPAYQKSLELDPDQFESRANLGDVCLQLDRTEEAIDALRQAAKIKPNDVKVHFLLAQCYLKAGNRDDALREYGIVKRLDSSVAEDLAKSMMK